jgi:hypothetical protein
MLRAEGAVLLAGGAASYRLNGEPWWLFALLLLAPDVSMVGYLAGPRVGAALYNVFHSCPLPAALGLFGLLAGAPLAVNGQVYTGSWMRTSENLPSTHSGG